jgi:hypothetical protein
VADEELDGTDVVRQFLGERQRVAPQTRKPLPQGVVETFDVIRLPGVLRNSVVLAWRNHALIDLRSSGVDRGLRWIDFWDLRPELCPTLTTPVAHVKRHDLARLGVHGHPAPWLVRLLPDEAPHFIGLGFQPPHDHGCWLDWELDREVIGAGCDAFHSKVPEPREADAHSPADPA